MSTDKPTVVVTGIAGNLGLRLLRQLGDFSVVGLDRKPPVTDLPLRFQAMDLEQEESTRQLFLLLRDIRPVAVVHLAFVIDPVRTGILDLDRMWRINVPGTARVMEAITEANRSEDCVQQFIFPSSVSVYGSNTSRAATEDSRLGAHTLPYAMHKQQSDEVVQLRAPSLRNCSAYILRPHIFAGATVDNYLLGAFRGTPNGTGKWAGRLRARHTRLPCILPMGRNYLEHRIQFVHVDDMARLIAHILRIQNPAPQRLTVLNVAGRGEPLTFGRCIEIAQARLLRIPTRWAFGLALHLLWKLGISAVPPEAEPYIAGEYIMDTSKLRSFLGNDYEKVIQFTVEEAFADCFQAAGSGSPAGALTSPAH